MSITQKIAAVGQYKVIFVVLAVLVLVAGATYGGLYWSIGKKEQNISGLLVTIQEESKKTLQIKTLTDVVEKSKEDRAELDTYFLKTDGIVGFIEKIESLGSSAGITPDIKGVNVLGEGGGVLDIQLETKGSLRGTLQFLTLLELLPGALSFEKVFITESGTDKEKTWEGDFIVHVLSFRK